MYISSFQHKKKLFSRVAYFVDKSLVVKKDIKVVIIWKTILHVYVV